MYDAVWQLPIHFWRRTHFPISKHPCSFFSGMKFWAPWQCCSVAPTQLSGDSAAGWPWHPKSGVNGELVWMFGAGNWNWFTNKHSMLVRRDQNDFGCQMTCTTNRKSQIGHFKGFHRGQWPQERRETSASSRDVQISPKWHSLLLVLGGKNLSESIWRPKIPIDISERHYQ